MLSALFVTKKIRIRSYLVMLPMKHQVSRGGDPRARNRCQLLRKPREPHRLVDIPLRVLMRARHSGGEEVAVGIDGGGEAGGEPVEGDGLQDVVEGGAGAGVGPGEELLADPGEEGDGVARDGEGDGRGRGGVFERVGGAEAVEFGGASEAVLFQCGDVGWINVGWCGHDAEVDVDCLAGRVLGGHDAADFAADVAALHDVGGEVEGGGGEFVEEAGDVAEIEVFVGGWWGGEGVAGHGGGYEVVGKGVGGVAGSEDVEHGKKFEKAAWTGSALRSELEWS
jgi:hypothetical protein